MKNEGNYFSLKPNIKNKKKTYLISKLPDNSPLRNQIKSSFDDVDKYLKVDRKIIIGNQQFQSPRRSENIGIVPWSIVGPVSIYEETELAKLRRSTFHNTRLSSSSMIAMKKEEKQKNPAFEMIDDSKLKMIYQQYEDIFNAYKDKSEYMENLPEEIGNKLKNQENSLLTHSLEEKKFNEMAKYLSRRTKKNEDELLVNKFYKIGENKQIYANSEKHRPLNERHAAHSWELSLRRPKNFKGTRFSYINLGDNYNPIWQLVKETVPDPVEIISKPVLSKDDKKINRKEELLKEVILNNTSIARSLETINNLKEIELKGKGLLQQEIESSKILTGRKILYKKEFLENPYHEGSHPGTANNYNADPTKSIRLSTLPKIFFQNYNLSPLKRATKIKSEWS